MIDDISWPDIVVKIIRVVVESGVCVCVGGGGGGGGVINFHISQPKHMLWVLKKQLKHKLCEQ